MEIDLNFVVELFKAHPIGQTLGVVAYLLTAFALSQKSDIKLRILMAIAAFIWSIHYFAIDAITAGFMVLIIAIRTSVSVFTFNALRPTRIGLTKLFIFVNTIGLFATWHGWVSILPFVSASVATIAMFLLYGSTMRLSLIVVEISWLCHNILTMSVGGVVANMTNIGILSTKIIQEKFSKK